MPYVGTYTWAASPGEIANYKYVVNNGSADSYESVGTANADPADNQDNRFRQPDQCLKPALGEFRRYFL